MAEINGGGLIAKVLKQEGVDTLYGLCGGHIDPIFQGCVDEDIRVIGARHEQAAVFMAEGHAWVTGQPGVAAVTAGPGVMNAVTGLWTALGRGAPIIVFGGRSPLREFEQGSLQDVDSLSVARTVTKWARAGYETSRIAEYVSMAFRQALSGRPGPTYLEFPTDVLFQRFDENDVVIPEQYRAKTGSQGDAALVQEAVDMLLGADRPLIIPGSGVWWGQAMNRLLEFVELTSIPLARGNFPSGGQIGMATDHPLHMGIKLRGNRSVGLDKADVVLLLGARLDWRLGFGGTGYGTEDSRWIQVDIEPTEIGRNRPVDIGIQGDAGAVLGQMLEIARGGSDLRAPAAWVQECQEQRTTENDELETLMGNDAVPIHPDRLCREIRDAVDPDAILVVDGGHIVHRAVRSLKTEPPGQMLTFGPTGTLGTGPSYAIAAKIAHPDQQVVLLSGDGSFGLNGMEFDTMVRHGIPIVCVVANDSCWAAIVHDQMRSGNNRLIETQLGEVRYDKIVESLGGYGEEVHNPEDIGPAIQRAFDSGLPACINVWCQFV
jgi:acetolactate synthase-1/2/3 large subunit